MSPSTSAPNVSTGSPGPGGKVRIRNAAVHILYRRLIGVAIVAILATGVSMVALWLVWGRPVPPQYIPVDAEGRLQAVVPLDKPNVDHGAVGQFAWEAVRSINTYDYINALDQLNKSQKYFTASGWNAYQEEYRRSSTLNAVRSRQMIVSLQPKGVIDFVDEGVHPQAKLYVWRLSVPVQIEFTGHLRLPNGTIDPGNRESGTITLYVVRVPLEENPSGLAVQLYIMTPDRPST